MKSRILLGFIVSILVGVCAQAQQKLSDLTANGYGIADRGKDFAIFSKVTSLNNALGQTISKTNQFTLLENNLHYFEDGVWKSSEDLIELAAEGAVARRGPDKAIFSPDLNSETVFDINTSDGLRLRGGVRAIQLTDRATGKSFILATVKPSAPGELAPPNQIVYRAGFDGLDADVVYVWKHNLFSQNVVLKERPALPIGMDEKSTVLEVLTEFVEPPDPVLNETVLKQDGRPDFVDEVTIGFGQMLILRGHAFSAAADKTLTFGVANLTDSNAVPVVKQWQTLDNGRKFLVESVGWQEIAPLLQDLPAAQRSENGVKSGQRAARVWPKKAAPTRREPMQMASLPYKANGCVLDYESLSGAANNKIFDNGITYCIQNSFYLGPGTATFKPGCVIKYGPNAWLLMYGYVSFPDTLQTPVFTSKDDNSFGEIIGSGNPTYAASQALWIYYVAFYTEIRNARIRWATRGVEYDTNPGVQVTHSIRDSLFENCSTGVYLSGNSHVTLTNVKKHNVTTPVGGAYCGCSMSDPAFYTDQSFAGLNVLDSGDLVPDTMGVVGPNHLVELLNGFGDAVAAFSKTTGHLDERLAPDVFFAVPNSSYPVGELEDAKLLYDPQGQRWVACGIDKGSQQVILAVSNSGSPVPLASNWSKYLVQIARTGSLTDSSTLGFDVNGIYISVFHYHWEGVPPQLVNDGNTVVAVNKPLLYQGTFQHTDLYTSATEINTLSIQPIVNFDNPPLNGHAWFVAKGPPQGQGANYKGGAIQYRRLIWSGINAQWVDSSWLTVSDSQPSYLNYFDFDSAEKYAPQLGGSAVISLQRTGSRLRMPVIRNNFLWTCQHVGLDGTDGDYGGNETGSSCDRSAVQWIKLQVNSSSPPLTCNSHDRVYDAASAAPYFYYMPSLMVNSAGDMVLGFSGSKSTEYIGAFYTGRLANGTIPTKPTLIQSGKAYFSDVRWGDYSYTSLDPTDSSTFWSVQEYAESPSGVFWGTWVVKIRLNP